MQEVSPNHTPFPVVEVLQNTICRILPQSLQTELLKQFVVSKGPFGAELCIHGISDGAYVVERLSPSKITFKIRIGDKRSQQILSQNLESVADVSLVVGSLRKTLEGFISKYSQPVDTRNDQLIVPRPS
jgi:hypothetical protein